MKHIHKPVVAAVISIAAMFIAVPMASAQTLYPIGYGTTPSVSQLNMHSGRSQNDWVSGVAGSNQGLCAAYWAYGETLYFVGDGQLQADNTWYDLYNINYYASDNLYPFGWSNSAFVNYPGGRTCNTSAAAYQE